MRFGSVCSGIEAASVAWEPLGWKAAWFSEIEPFPCAVLKHHYPDVSNLGDMTALPDRILSGEVEAPDLFCGGTPCQAFSVAGLRKSLDDARGNLSLTFCEIANAIDHVRAVRSAAPAIIFWENVPGVLNTSDNAFGCFLGALAGEDEALIAPGGRWTNAGFIDGPQRTVAWRVLDAQYFGVAQRRRRVFVVASAREGFDPAEVLFEFDGVRRDFAPSREAWQKPAPTIAGCANGGGANGPGRDVDSVESLQVVQPYTVGNTLTARMHKGMNSDCNEGQTPVLHAVGVPDVMATLLSSTAGISRPGNAVTEHITYIPMATQPITFSSVQSNQEINANLPVSQTLEATNPMAVAHPIGTDLYNGAITGDVAVPLTNRADGTGTGPSVLQPIGLDEEQNAMINAFGTLKARTAGGGFEGAVMQTNMAVRRLTPVECERLQGFPDGYTAIPWRSRPKTECPDGPRYKALGNSWAVPVVRWIGKRIKENIA